MDHQTFNGLYDAHCVAILRFLKHRFKLSVEDAQDLAQDVWVGVAKAASPVKNGRAFVYQIARRRGADFLRRLTAAKRKATVEQLTPSHSVAYVQRPAAAFYRRL
jgi:DNA-directed RNA polymerase specialized sigma24 family protein